jgi:hypothetical protein
MSAPQSRMNTPASSKSDFFSTLSGISTSCREKRNTHVDRVDCHMSSKGVHACTHGMDTWQVIVTHMYLWRLGTKKWGTQSRLGCPGPGYSS